MADRLVDRWDEANWWHGNAEGCGLEEVDGHGSVLFRLQKDEEVEFAFNVDLRGMPYFSFSAMEIRGKREEIRTIEDCNLEIQVGSWRYQFLAKPLMQRCTFPTMRFEDLETVRFRALKSGVYAVSDLHAWNPEMPADLLYALRRSLQEEMLSMSGVPAGRAEVLAGDKTAIVEDWEFLEENAVLSFGGELHQIASRIDNKVSFLTTFDGNAFLQDFSGDVEVYLPVEVGYYDREAQLPGISIWYRSPRPANRTTYGGETLECFVAGMRGNPFIDREGMLQEWTVDFEVSARSPELVQRMSHALRKFLAKSHVWMCGQKLWWNWVDPVRDTDPILDYDAVPRAVYTISLEVLEEVFDPPPSADFVRRANVGVYGRLN